MHFFKPLSIFVFFLSFSLLSFAGSGDPCSPTVRAAPSNLSCIKDGLNYSIVISTKMSPPIEACMGSKHIEVSSANIKIYSSAGRLLGTLELPIETFTYSGGLPGTSSGFLRAQELGLLLEGCTSPAHGGMSASN